MSPSAFFTQNNATKTQFSKQENLDRSCWHLYEDVKFMLNNVLYVLRKYLPSFLSYWESSPGAIFVTL